MKLKVEDLAQDYEQYDKLDIHQLIPFVQKNIKHKNPVTRFFNGMNIVVAMLLIGLGGYKIGQSEAIMTMIIQVCFGFSIALLIIPVHEWIHGLAYKHVGAKKINYTANWKKFYFTAQADHFILNEKEFRLVAFAPLVVITSLAIVLGLVSGQYLLMLGLIFAHTTMCGGDFALVSYFYQNRGKGLVTYDDYRNQIAYFFVEKTN